MYAQNTVKMNLVNRINKLPNGGRLILKRSATIADTVRAIDAVSAADSARPEVKKIAGKLKTPENILKYVHSHIAYQPDTGNLQTVRTWQRLHQDKIGNCVDYTAAISSLLKATGTPHIYRVTDYGNGYAHIYPVITAGSMDAVTLQGEPAKVGNEQTYKRKRDFMPQLAILNGPTTATGIVRDAITPVLAKTRVCGDMYRWSGGAIRAAMKTIRNTPRKFTAGDVDTAVRLMRTGCNAITCGTGLIQECNNYVTRNRRDIRQLAPGEDMANLAGSGTTAGGGRPLTTGGPVPPAAPPATGGGFNLASALPLALLAGVVLMSRKK